MLPQATTEIDPRRQYDLKQAAALLQAIRGRGSVGALRWYYRTGRLRCIRGADRRLWISGGELSRFLSLDQQDFQGRTPSEVRRATQTAQSELRRMGVIK